MEDMEESSEDKNQNCHSEPQEIIDKKKRKCNWPAWIQALSAVALVFFTYLLTYYANTQYKATLRAVDLSNDSVTIARETLKSGEKTQADTLAEMKAQSRAMQSYSDSVRESIKIAERGMKISEKNIKLIEEQFRLEQRPWLQVANIKFHTKLENNKESKFSLEIMNVGKTPAQNVRFKSVYHILEKGKPDDIAEIPSGHVDVSIGPGRYIEEMAIFEPLTREVVKGIEDGTMTLKILLTIKYKDIFDINKDHETGFCGEYDPKYGLQLVICESGNYMR